MDNKTVITKDKLNKYDNTFINKIKHVFCELYKSYDNVLEQLSYLLNFQDEIINSNESIQRLVLKLNKEWIKEFI